MKKILIIEDEAIISFGYRLHSIAGAQLAVGQDRLGQAR